MNPYIIEACFLCTQIVIADYEAKRFSANKNISHFWWAIVVCLLIATGWYITDQNWMLAICLALERIFAFNTLLNFFRHEPFFYVHSGVGGSWLDSKIGDAYPYIFLTSLAAFITLNFFVNG